MTKTKTSLFQGKKIRRVWDEKKEEWYFSVVDIVGVLSTSSDPRNYWKVLKSRLKQEGSEVVTKCNQLKLEAADGKYYLTDVADTEVLFRIIQSIKEKPQTFPENRKVARAGGNIAGGARRKIEKRLKKSIITGEKFLPIVKK